LRDLLQRHPFLLLTVALAGGIACGDALYFRQLMPLPANTSRITLFCIAIALLFITHYCARKIRFRPLFTLTITVLCWMLGMMLSGDQLHTTRFSPPPTATDYAVTIEEQPERKARSILCRVTDDTTRQQYLLYLAPDSAAAALTRGDRLWVHARLSPPRNFHADSSFDYARYLTRKGISGTGYVASGYWQQAGHDDTRTWSQRARDYRAHIVEIYRKLGFSGDNLGVLSALTVGHKEELSEEIRNTYAVTGVAHVLALSGLHIGILYALCLIVVGKGRRRRILGTLLFVLPVLWAFALLTGLSASVVRSVIMFSLLALSHLSPDRRPYTLNILLATAFFMLLFRPLWLFDVGFQLSFVAVASIHFIQPRLYRLLPQSGTRLLQWRAFSYFFGLFTVAIAAQAGTAPLISFYFHRLPVHFLWTNLCIVPLVGLCLCTAGIMLLLTPFTSVLQQGTAWLLNVLLNTQHRLLHLVEQLPMASIETGQTDGWDILFYYFFLVGAIRCMDACTVRNVYFTLISLLLLIIHSIVLRSFFL
jgi:competence protein ComEC